MKNFAFVVLILFSAVPAWAQRPASTKSPLPSAIPAAVVPTAVPETVQPSIPAVTSDLKPTPEMWFYEQNMREYKNPKNAVRAKAEFDAQQRSNRLATMRWYGYSNSRPRVGADPINSYSPAWSSNTPLQPNRWQGTGSGAYYIARPEISVIRAY
jgi:hypothetical protein